LTKFDTSKDGKISLQEFVVVMEQHNKTQWSYILIKQNLSSILKLLIFISLL
jgi:Ca2+-binding EF-hand superfamily protein